LWDEYAGPVEPSARILGRNLFCSGHCWLGDGRLLVAGGQSWNWFFQTAWGADHDLHSFDWQSQSWSRHADMPAARYYPTCVTLADGDSLIVGGAWTRVPMNRVNHDAERFHWRTSTVSPRVPFNPGFIDDLYPFLQLFPDGSPQGLLWVHSGRTARLYSPASGAWLAPSFNANSGGSRNYPRQGSFALLPLLPQESYRVRLILVGGGSTSRLATDEAEIFEFDAARPEQSHYRAPAGGRQGFARFMSDATLLADGSVLISGGAGAGAADHSENPVLTSEIFDPVTETFRPSADINRHRMYHSTALLLPSGRVALSGHTQHWNPEHPAEDTTVEIYTPDYLLAGPRPRLTSAPARAAYDELLHLTSPDAGRVSQVALVRAASVTHSNNMDQRWIGLVIESREWGGLSARVPADPAVAPPGHYMIFLLDTAGVPSIARFVFLDPDLQPDRRVLVVDRWIPIPEASAGVDTLIYLESGDQFTLEAQGEIWAGVALTGRNGPAGWHNVDHDSKFPLHSGSNAHPFALIGRFGEAGPWFYVGDRLGPQRYTETQSQSLWLRTNDDSPGNGSGRFMCHVRVWRDEAAAQIAIARAVINPPGDDVAFDAGEFAVLQNVGARAVDLAGWWLSDDAGNRLVIRGPRMVMPGAVLNVHTGPGTTTELDYFCGRRQAVWNNSGDTIYLHAPDGRVVADLAV
jgi:Galactose oxidase-like, Early set domain/Lamin Tail Domain/Glyoxal oxidase N-terminus